MSNPTPPNPGELKYVRGSNAPGISILVGYMGYMFWEHMKARRNGKRREEIRNEVMRRGKVIEDGNKEILRLMTEADG